ncbi:MAG TPA: aminoacylase, partial [Candidatus Bathyarchaeota archaeon]|nr:aminoacylase [Candidatus Bathyarchaeota archaeon]
MGSTEFDLAILNGRVIDGAGNPWFKADLAIKGDEIAWMGKRFKGESRKTLDASGCFVVPGFIDAHSHADFTSLVHRDMENLVHQGITTVVAGQCGSSLAPLSDLSREEAEKSLQGSLPEGVELKLTWSTFEEYLREEEKERMGVNVAHMVGHGAVRAAAMGFEARPPTDEELDHMRELVEEAMKAGAFGLSTGLIYPPGLYAETSEIVELAKVAARFGGVYDSHIRGEGRGLMKALREALEIGFQAGIPVQISHHKIASKRLWGKSVETLKLFEEARSKGLDVTLDQYPYVAGSTSLMALLPPWVHDGGREKALERLRDEEARKKIRRDISEGIEGWENFAGELGWSNVYVTYVQSEANKHLEGLNLTEI